MSYPVKWFSSEMEGAPNMGQAVAVNQLIPVLKAFLVTGFGLKTADSMTYDPVTQQALITISSGHKYLVDSVVTVSGANEAGYPGEHRVTWVSATQLKVEMPTAPTVNTATGTITVKVAPLGWQVLAEDAATNRIIFASTDPAANGLALCVDNGAWTDNGAWNSGQTSGVYGIRAKCSVVKNVVDINTYTTEIAQLPWPASHRYAASTWYAIGDQCLFYFLPKYSSWGQRVAMLFGEGVSFRAGDKFMTMLTHIATWGSTNGDSQWNSTIGGDGRYNSVFKLTTTNQKIMARDYHQLPGTIGWRLVGLSHQTRMGAGSSYPNPSDNGIYVQSDPPLVFAKESDIRGYMPGLRNMLNGVSALDGSVLKNLPNLPGKSLLCILCAYEEMPSSTSQSVQCFDITGPWR